MAELVDASDSKSDSARSAGSIPARGTIATFSSIAFKDLSGVRVLVPQLVPHNARMKLTVTNRLAAKMPHSERGMQTGRVGARALDCVERRPNRAG